MRRHRSAAGVDRRAVGQRRGLRVADRRIARTDGSAAAGDRSGRVNPDRAGREEIEPVGLLERIAVKVGEPRRRRVRAEMHVHGARTGVHAARAEVQGRQQSVGAAGRLGRAIDAAHVDAVGEVDLAMGRHVQRRRIKLGRRGVCVEEVDAGQVERRRGVAAAAVFQFRVVERQERLETGHRAGHVAHIHVDRDVLILVVAAVHRRIVNLENEPAILRSGLQEHVEEA